MPKTSYTPGPWAFTEVQSPERGHRLAIHQKGTGAYVAQINLGDLSKDAKANARLIASAPELLEALGALQGYCLRQGILPEGEPLGMKVRAAILKATETQQ